MSEAEFPINNSLEARKILIINQLFIETADQEYVSARWAFNNGMFYPCYTLSAQAIEKYMKAVLLFNDCDTRTYGHDLIRLWQDIKQFDVENILPQKLSWPEVQNNNKLSFEGKSTDDFIKYLSVFGSPDNRYGSFGTNLDGSLIFAIDSICFSIRKLIRINNFCSEDIYEHNKNEHFSSNEISETQSWMLSPNFLLERLASDTLIQVGEKRELRHIFKNMNFAFAPNYVDHSGSFGGFHSISFPIHNFLVRHRRLDNSDENNAVIDQLEAWVMDHIFISKQVKSSLII